MLDPSPPPPKPRSSLAIIAAILAVTLLLSLGLCGYTMGHANFNNMPTSAGVELLGIVGSAVGLVIVGILAIVRSGRRRS